MDWTLLLAFMAGSFLGTLVVWAYLRSRAQVQFSVFHDLLQEKERAIDEVRQNRDELQQEVAGLRDRLGEEVQKRSSAEERSSRVPVLEAQVEKGVQEQNRLMERIAELRERISRLETELEEERSAAAEKLELMEDARKRLEDTFKALASEA